MISLPNVKRLYCFINIILMKEFRSKSDYMLHLINSLSDSIIYHRTLLCGNEVNDLDVFNRLQGIIRTCSDDISFVRNMSDRNFRGYMRIKGKEIL